MTAFLESTFGLGSRRALVTGAGTGIGGAMAKALAAAGAEVAVHYNSSREGAEAVVAAIQEMGGSAWAIQADLRGPDGAAALADQLKQRWAGLDIAILNAGDMIERRKVAEFSPELLEQVLQVNIHTAVYALREVIPLLQGSAAPSIVLLSSVAAHHGGGNGSVIYAAAKGAIHTMVRGLSKELAPKIRVNGLSPGFILTDFHHRYSSPENQQATIAATALKRAGAAEDMGAAVVFLTSSGASFITGEVIEINGGLWFA